MERASPELILVDPELALAARRLLDDPGDCLARRFWPGATTGPARRPEPATSTVLAHGERHLPRAERPLPSFLAVLGALLTALVVGSPLLDLLPADVERPSFARTGERGPAAGTETESDASKPVRLQWREVRGADFYDVVLWREGRRVTDLWPKTNAVAIENTGDGATALGPGTYQWFVFPAFNEDGSTRFGASVARGKFRVG